MSGVILYDGPSRIDGQPIVAIATSGSLNRKTGSMVQTWIMLRDIPPHEAIRTGADVSVCGSCILRGKSCYVVPWYGPLNVWRALHRGAYQTAGAADLCRGELLRLGSYGEPTAVPFDVWSPLLEGSAGHSGYTQRWARDDCQEYRGTLMASVHSVEQARYALELGWRYYRTRMASEQRLAHERMCPASKEAGAHVTCARCLGCAGADQIGRPLGYTIVLHGNGARAETERRRVAA